jgi:Fic-DOC domain mobile mystery protein B
MKFLYPEGPPPFNQDDAAELIPKHITTQDQLNEWEQENIIKGEGWLFSRKRKNLLTIEFIRTLYKHMFNDTWGWAGKFRTHATNIGVEYYAIQESLKVLCDDVSYWIKKKEFPIDEIAVRFHHRLVEIHAFPNGNGCHARLMTDALLVQLAVSRFSWGKRNLLLPSETCKEYIKALKQADKGNYTFLLNFVRE